MIILKLRNEVQKFSEQFLVCSDFLNLLSHGFSITLSHSFMDHDFVIVFGWMDTLRYSVIFIYSYSVGKFCAVSVSTANSSRIVMPVTHTDMWALSRAWGHTKHIPWCCDRHAVGLSVLVSGTPLGSVTRFFFCLSFAGQLLCSSSWSASLMRERVCNV
jgi:hypothetical protein